MKFEYISIVVVAFGLSGCWAQTSNTSDFYDKPFRLVSSTSASVFNSNASLDTNVSNCRTRLSCVGNAVSPQIQTFDVLTIKQTGQYWRSVIVQNSYIPQLDIAFDLVQNGVDVAGRSDGDGASVLWQLLKVNGSTQCLRTGPCQNSQTNVVMSGKGDDAQIVVTWADGTDTWKRWVGYCGPLEPCNP